MNDPVIKDWSVIMVRILTAMWFLVLAILTTGVIVKVVKWFMEVI